jgi:hypothetical protein
MFDGVVDPLNWLNQCEQFFRGQRTLASDRTWLASYHLRGAAQTWYYALERDEGMPTWERFRAVCQMQFGPPTQGTRLAELACLPFTPMVQEYAERYNTVLCHTDDDLGPRQKAKLFVGGLPEHIWVDVEMRRVPRGRISGFSRATSARATAVSALQPPTSTTGAGRDTGRHLRRVCLGTGHHATPVPAFIPSRAVGTST